jgi:hypothetical protein
MPRTCVSATEVCLASSVRDVITVPELRGIRIFTALPDAALDYLTGAVEDIRLAAGEYFAHEATSGRCSWSSPGRSRSPMSSAARSGS